MPWQRWVLASVESEQVLTALHVLLNDFLMPVLTPDFSALPYIGNH